MAPEIDRPEVRWNGPSWAGATAHRRSDRVFSGSHGGREPGLGVSTNPGCPVQSGARASPQHDRADPGTTRHRPGTGTDPEDDVAGVSEPALGADRDHGLFHHGSVDQARAAAIYGSVLHGTLRAEGPDCGDRE